MRLSEYTHTTHANYKKEQLQGYLRYHQLPQKPSEISSGSTAHGFPTDLIPLTKKQYPLPLEWPIPDFPHCPEDRLTYKQSPETAYRHRQQ